MPRPERPVDPDAGVVQRFAMELRELRRRAGGPGYRQLARRAHYAATTLAQAARGDVLPSLAVTLAYVRACDGDPVAWEARWRAVADEVGPMAERVVDAGPAPYVGLAAFRTDDAEWFFGRDQLIVDLRSRLGQRRFVGVFGPSGSGKSSLLRAGLVPALPQPVVVFTPGARPLQECAVQLAWLTGGSACSMLGELAADPANLHLLIRQYLVGRPADEELVLVVDQFEELFTLCTDDVERAGFVDALVGVTTAATSRARVVLGTRADFYGRCADHPRLVGALRDAQVLVGPMTADELRLAITGPAERAGLRVETALVSRLVADATGQPGVLPLVSHALLQTWHRRRGTTLTLDAYRAVGGIQHALVRTAEATYSGLDAGRQRLARQLFQRLAAPGDGTEDLRRRLRHDELDHDDVDTAMVLDTLAEARLITLDGDGVQLAHEALIRHWPRLRDWLSQDREGLRVHRELTEAARAWRALQDDPGAYYRGARLARAQDWAGTTPAPDLTAVEREFLDASIAAQTAERATARRRTRRLQQLTAMLAVLLVAATAATVHAVRAQHAAGAQRDLAVIDNAINQIAVLNGTARSAGSDRRLAFALSVAAYRVAPNPRTRGGVLSSQPTPWLSGMLVFSPDGRLVANPVGGGSLHLLRPAVTGYHPVVGTHSSQRHDVNVTAAAFGPDATTLMVAEADWSSASGSAIRDTHVVLYSVADPTRPAELAVTAGTLSGPGSISPDGRTAAVIHRRAADSDGVDDVNDGFDEIDAVQLIDISDPREPVKLSTLTDHRGPAMSAVFAPTGGVLATVGLDQITRLWDVTDPRHPIETARINATKAPMVEPIFSPDGRLFVTRDHRSIQIWNVTDPHHPAGTTIHIGPIGRNDAITFSPDGRLLATVAADQQVVRLWDLTDPRHPTETAGLTGHTGPVTAVAFSPDGRTLASGGTDLTIRLWDVADPYRAAESVVLTGHSNPVTSLTYSPDGHTLATASQWSSETRLWQTDLARILEHACDAPDRPTITDAEWDRYLPGVPNSPPCP